MPIFYVGKKGILKPPINLFKELSDDYSFEIIPTVNILLGTPSMEVDSQSENEDDSNFDMLVSKQRGRLLGSKKKSSGKKIGDNRLMTSIVKVFAACPNPSIVSS